ncbi:MAG: hypothetical protein RR382_00210 [Tannerellaceae bacterium]
MKATIIIKQNFGQVNIDDIADAMKSIELQIPLNENDYYVLLAPSYYNATPVITRSLERLYRESNRIDYYRPYKVLYNKEHTEVTGLARTDVEQERLAPRVYVYNAPAEYDAFNDDEIEIINPVNPDKPIEPRKDLFDGITSEDFALMDEIAMRAKTCYVEDMHVSKYEVDSYFICMYLAACHNNGCKLRLDDMLKAKLFDLMHDIIGIRNHINKYTGELDGHFRPRFAQWK